MSLNSRPHASAPAESRGGEPVLWTVDYGRPRVFVTLLGHDGKCMQDRHFQATLLQGTRWAAGANRKMK